jgi:hypothetical protein
VRRPYHARLDGSTGAVLDSTGVVISGARNGVGDYTFTLGRAVDPGEVAIEPMVVGATLANAVIEFVSSTQVRVRCSSAGVAVDPVALRLAIRRATSARPQLVITAPMGPLVALNTRLFVSLSGQSNSSPGSGGAPALSVAQPFDNLRRSGAAVVPLVETTVETLASGLANWLSEQEPGRGALLDGWGVSATAYAGLAQGTGPYNGGLAAVSTARAAHAAARPSETFRAAALAWVHGETDEVNNVSSATYRGFMEALQLAWQTDVRAALGVTDVIPLIMTQHASHSRLPRPNGALVPCGQEDAARANPGAVLLSHPTYHVPYVASDIHYTNVGHRRNGEYLAKVLRRSLLLGQPWTPLRPASIVAVGSTITIDFEGGDGSALVFDAVNMRQKPHQGFEYTDGQGDVPAIVSVDLTGARQVTLTLSRNAQAGGRVRYAFSCVAATDAGPTSLGGLGGNLRDQDPTPSRQGGENALWNWCVSFDRPLDSVSGAASPAAAFANTQSVDVTGGAFLSARDVPGLDGSGAVTWAWWQRTNGAWPAVDQVAMSRNTANQRQFDFRLRTGSSMRFTVSNGLASAADFVDVGGWTATTWQHVVVVFAAGVVTVYRNGVAVVGTVNGTIPAVLSSGSTQDVEIGASAAVNGADLNVAHAMIWVSRALSAGEVTELYNAGVPRDPRALSFAAPSHYWPCQGTYEDLGAASSRNLFPYGSTFQPIAP